MTAEALVPVVQQTDLGPVAYITWPKSLPADPESHVWAENFPQRAFALRVVDVIRATIPDAIVWVDRELVSIRQEHPSHDVVLIPGDTVVIAAGAVARMRGND